MVTDRFEQIRYLINEVRQKSSNIAVLAVINVKTHSKQLEDYHHHSIRSSFLNDWEIDDFISSLRRVGFFVQHFADEEDFFSWVLSGKYEGLRIEHKLVYTSASNGIGPGRRALVPAFCRHKRIPTLNSNAYSCAINRHKFHVSRLLSAFGIRVPRTWYYIPDEGWWDSKPPPRGLKVIAKATYEGSSVGVEDETIGPFTPVIENRIDRLSKLLSQPITVQELIEGYEIEVPVIRLFSHHALGAAVLSLHGSTKLDESVLSYREALNDTYSYESESAVPASIISCIYSSAELVAKIFDFDGISRIDFRITPSGTQYVIDVSSTPHLTRSNAVNYLFCQAGLEYCDTLAALVGAGCLRYGIIHSSDQNSSSEARKPFP